MIVKRPAAQRGHVKFDWLDTWHTFSFGDYRDPEWMGFGPLRVINDDRVAPGGGFPTHPHRDMEILTFILDGALEHRDSMGNGAVIRPGDVQKMSAGTGVMHSEFNPSATEAVHLLQVWIVPETRGLNPEYQQIRFEPEANCWQLVASMDGRNGSIVVHQDVAIHRATLEAGAVVNYQQSPGRAGWLHVATGGIALNGETLEAGGGAGISEENSVRLMAEIPSEVLLFDLVI